MGYYDIYHLLENENWQNRCRREGGELLVEEGSLACPHCLFPFMRARLVSHSVVTCPYCQKEIQLPE